MDIKRFSGLVLGIAVCFVFSVLPGFSAEKISGRKVGFLVLAPDRGFLGNQEISHLFQEFQKEYPAALTLVGRDYNGVNSEYAVYIQEALASLKGIGVTDVVALPLFLSKADPVLKKVAEHLPAYAASGGIRLAPPLSQSHLTAQILLDRVQAESREPEREHVVILGIGAMDEADERGIRADFEPLLSYVKQYVPFKSVEVGIYYDRNAEASLREKKNKEVDDLVIRAAAKKGRTIVAPFYIGPRFDNRMSMTHWLSGKFGEYDLAFIHQEMMPHPNLLLWLKKTANHYLTPAQDQVGVVIMPHGSTQPYNDVVERVILPLQSRYRIEMAYGMGDPALIQQAVSRLEAEGVRRIVFVRMYSLEDQMKGLTDYILGLSESPPASHAHGEAPPAQVRSSALFSTFGGYEEGADVSEALHDRVVELSRNPAEETVILVAHGSGSDEANQKWLEVMQGHAARLRERLHAQFRDIQAATVREDWPDKREAAVDGLKKMIEAGKRNGRVLLISNRLYGAGPYERFLEGVGLKKGEDYDLNGKGFAPHPLMTRWLESGIEAAIRGFHRETEWAPSEGTPLAVLK